MVSKTTDNTPVKPSDLMTIETAARRKKCSMQTIRNAIDSGKLRGFRIGKRFNIVVRDEQWTKFRVQEAGRRVSKKKREGK